MVVGGVLLPGVTGAFDRNLQWLNISGDYMDNYDMAYMNPSSLDWPVGTIWGCNGRLNNVRSYMASGLAQGYKPISENELTPCPHKFLRVWENSFGGAAEWPGDCGNQTACFSGPDGWSCYEGDQCNKHTRSYAPGGGSGFFYNTSWEYYSVATQHYDKNHDTCVGSGPERFGWSENVENSIRNAAKADGYPIKANLQDMQNGGTGWIDDKHYHQNDGYASYIDFGNCWTPTPRPTPKPTATPTPSK